MKLLAHDRLLPTLAHPKQDQHRPPKHQHIQRDHFGRQFLVYSNYEAILGYNCANAYALSVAMLGDRIKLP